MKVLGYSPLPFVWQKKKGEWEAMFIAMELAEGGSLFEYVKILPFNEDLARNYFRQLIEGIDYMHGHGVVHRDLKMENLLFDGAFNLKIADFGFNCPTTGHDGSGWCKTAIGTASYRAPEIMPDPKRPEVS